MRRPSVHHSPPQIKQIRPRILFTESPIVPYLFQMPNVIHIDCQCGHSDFVIVGFPCDAEGILRRVRCISCGRRGAVADCRMGWIHDGALDQRDAMRAAEGLPPMSREPVG